MRYYLDLYLTSWQLFLKELAQYRADFIIMSMSTLLHTGASLVFITLIFNNVRQLQGWTFHEVLLIYALMATVEGVRQVFLDVPHYIQGYIQRGELDGLLVRPPSILFQIITRNGINPGAFSRTFVGVVAMAIALRTGSVPMVWWWALYLPLVVVSGALLMFSIYLLLACLSFRFTNVHSILSTTAWSSLLGKFPVTIYAAPLQFILTWVLPFAMMGFYPAAFLLRGEEYRLYGLLAPFMGFLFLVLALAVWRMSIRHYQSTGS